MSKTQLQQASEDLERFGSLGAPVYQPMKRNLIAEEFKSVVRQAIPSATDEQITDLFNKLTSEGELCLTTIYDMSPVAPLPPGRRR